MKTSEITNILRKKINEFDHQISTEETGHVISISDGIARVYGLDHVQSGEWVEIIGKDNQIILGIAQNLELDHVGVIVVGKEFQIEEGNLVKRTKQIVF